MSLSDARRMYVLLRDADAEGCHSHELRRQGVSGNPSQRAKDIVSHGVAIWTARENVGKRPGARYWLAEHAPDWAVPVRPNHSSKTGTVDGNGPLRGSSAVNGPSAQERLQDKQEVAGSNPAPGAVQPPSITPAPEQVAIREPVAIVRDFTDPEGCWREVPVAELDFDYEAAA